MFILYDSLRPRDCGHFITFPGERLIIAKRQSPFLLVVPFIVLLLVDIVASIATWYVFVTILSNPFFLITWLLLESTLTLLIAIQIFYEWYYHIYIFTTRKIVEMAYSPPFMRRIHDILLDQVRVTEVNIVTKGVLHEFFDIGDVVICFDRLSHQELIVLGNVHGAHELGEMLSQMFELMMQGSPTWVNPRPVSNIYQLSDGQVQKPSLKPS